MLHFLLYIYTIQNTETAKAIINLLLWTISIVSSPQIIDRATNSSLVITKDLRKKTGTQLDSVISLILSRRLQSHKNLGHPSSHQLLILFLQPAQGKSSNQ